MVNDFLKPKKRQTQREINENWTFYRGHKYKAAKAAKQGEVEDKSSRKKKSGRSCEEKIENKYNNDTKKTKTNKRHTKARKEIKTRIKKIRLITKSKIPITKTITKSKKITKENQDLLGKQV